MIEHYWEEFRAWLSFKIFPEQALYLKVARAYGELIENERVVEVIEQSNLRNKKAVLDLVEAKYIKIDDLTQLQDDASESPKS